MHMVCDKNGIHWCEITYKGHRGWIKYDDVTLCKKIIPGNNLVVSLRATFGDGLLQWKYPVILDKRNRLKKDLRYIENFNDGFWVDNDKYFVFSDFNLLYSYTVSDNKVGVIDTAHAIFWDKDISRIIYLPQQNGAKRIVLKSVKTDGSDKKTIYDKIHPDFSVLGCHDGEMDFENLKVEYINGMKCYSFCAVFAEGYPYESQYTLFIDPTGNLLEKRERKE